MRALAVLLACFIVLGLLPAEGEARSRRTKAKDKKKWVKSKHGLGALLKLSKDRSKMVREYKKETHSFNRMKKALEKGDIKPGEDARNVKRVIGDPTLEIKENDGIHTRWVYKPSDTSYFEGNKVYLLFDQEDKLVKAWEIPPKN